MKDTRAVYISKALHNSVYAGKTQIPLKYKSMDLNKRSELPTLTNINNQGYEFEWSVQGFHTLTESSISLQILILQNE